MNEAVLKKLEEHDERFRSIEKSVGAIENRIGSIEYRVGSIENSVDSIQNDIVFLKEDARKNGIIFEDHQRKLDQILEVVMLQLQQSIPREDFEARFGNHEHRISALEHSIRSAP